MYTGGCINSSQAGKRRIPIGAEQQMSQFNGDDNDNLPIDNDDIDGNGKSKHSTGVLTPLTAITAIAIAGCLLIITIFVVIFAVLQVFSRFLI